MKRRCVGDPFCDSKCPHSFRLPGVSPTLAVPPLRSFAATLPHSSLMKVACPPHLSLILALARRTLTCSCIGCTMVSACSTLVLEVYYRV